jgi:hypothetical protein
VYSGSLSDFSEWRLAPINLVSDTIARFREISEAQKSLGCRQDLARSISRPEPHSALEPAWIKDYDFKKLISTVKNTDKKKNNLVCTVIATK